MSGKFEVLLTNDASGQMWNTCIWDHNTGSTLGTFKVILFKNVEFKVCYLCNVMHYIKYLSY
jgi:hypothetical protein